MPFGPVTLTAARARRSVHPAALLSLLATLALLLLAGLPATADAEIRPNRPCAAAKVRDTACPAQRFALQVTFDVDEPAGERSGFVAASVVAPARQPGPAFRRSADPLPPAAAGRAPERPPRTV
ncbi:hypothetical protein MET9862_03362 [Methylobacterium symbioticum]|uniref:Uncharacterized protein n=1 Tax=Methylobacterium symbioticum TaxID=2584084 RepID=A0A509EFD5_9HYPH|nr:hypothetical protein MET9862_03362 [Methylobacterium symbioticum]